MTKIKVLDGGRMVCLERHGKLRCYQLNEYIKMCEKRNKRLKRKRDLEKAILLIFFFSAIFGSIILLNETYQ